MRRRVTRFLSFALAATMLVTSQGFNVMAQYAGGIVGSEERTLPQNPLHSCQIGVSSTSQSQTSGYFSPITSVGSVSEDTTLWD